MKMNKEKFLKTELGGEIYDVIRALDYHLQPGDEFRKTAKELSIEWSAYKKCLKHFYGIDYAFTRTDDYFGVVNEDDDKDFLFKEVRDRE